MFQSPGAALNKAQEAEGEERMLIRPLGRFRDYRGAEGAGLEARLIRRAGQWSDGASRKTEEDLKGVQVVRSLRDIVDEVERRNER